jgi:hypothetical protein
MASLGPSPKQLQLMQKLASQINRDLAEFATEILQKPIAPEGIANLTSKETVRVINKLLGEQALSVPQIMLIMRDWPLEKLSRIFKMEITDYAQLKNSHMRILYNDRFNMRCLDHPIANTPDYEYGWQESTLCPDGKLYYLKFYTLMMLDYDGIELDVLLGKLSEWTPRYTFHIYQTYNGFHVYVVSQPIAYSLSKGVMRALDCDFFYMKFVQGNGFKIRLTPKLNRVEPFVEKWVCAVGSLPVHPGIAPLLEIRKRFFPEI